jgi:hypothetical protein
VIVLTFANQIQVPAVPGMLDYRGNYETFQKKQLWNDTLPDILNKLIVSSEIVIEVPTVPAGYYKVQHLPWRRYEFWKTALNHMKKKTILYVHTLSFTSIGAIAYN